jgi:conjugal transfer mating pair stabilization protein TraG
MGPMEYVAYGGGEYYRDVFNSVAMLAGSNGISSLIRLAMMLGLLAGIIKMAFDLNLKSLFQWYMMALLIYGIMWVPKVTVQVTDELNPYMAGGAVANVPLGVGMMASLTSQVGRRAIDLSEQAFGDLGDLRYSETGMIYGAKLVERLREVRPVNATFETNVQNYIARCVYQDVATEQLGMKQLQESGDLWTTISANPNPAVAMAYVNDAGQSVAMDCPQAAATLTPLWNGEVQKVIAAQASRLNPGMPAADAQARVRSTTESMHEKIIGASRDSTGIFQQAMLVNLMRRGVSNYTSDAGAGALDVLAETQAEVHTRNLQGLMGGIGERAVPILKIVIEVMLIGMFPVLFPAFLLPKTGPMMLKGYISGFIGLQAWGPLYVILNKIMMGQGIKDAAGSAQIPGVVAGINWSNLDAIGSANADVASLAGTMLMSVPLLVSMIMRGSFAVGGMGESLMRNFSSGAEAAAGAKTTGNFQFGNTGFDNHSFGNMSGNKWDTNSVHMEGTTSVQQPGGGMMSRYGDGSIGYSMATSQTAGGIETSKVLSQAAVERAHESRETGHNLSTAASQGASRTMSEQARYAESFTSGQASRFVEGSEERKAETAAHDVMEQASRSYQKEHGGSLSQARSVVGKVAAEAYAQAGVEGTLAPQFFGVGGGLKGSAGVRGSAGVEASGSTTSSEQTAARALTAATSNDSYTRGLQEQSAKYAQQSFERSSSASQMSSTEKADAFSSMTSLTDTASSYEQQAQRYEKVAETASTDSQTFRQDYNAAFTDWAVKDMTANGMSSSEAARVLDAKDGTDRAAYMDLQERFAGQQVEKMATPEALASTKADLGKLDFSSAPDVRHVGPIARESLDNGVGAGLAHVRAPSSGSATGLYQGPSQSVEQLSGEPRSAVRAQTDAARIEVESKETPHLMGADELSGFAGVRDRTADGIGHAVNSMMGHAAPTGGHQPPTYGAPETATGSPLRATPPGGAVDGAAAGKSPARNVVADASAVEEGRPMPAPMELQSAAGSARFSRR